MSPLRSWRLWAMAFVGAGVLTALNTVQSYASQRLGGSASSWQQVLPVQFIVWFGWAVLTPPIVTVAFVIPWRRGRERSLTAIWIGFGIAFVTCHALIEAMAVWGVEVALAARGRVASPSISFSTIVSGRLAETLVSGLIVVSIIVLSYYAVDHYRLARAREQRQLVLETHLARARLDALRNQLQPHFLFNTLHTISALVGDDVQAARRVITQLGDLLRTSLETAEQHEIPFRDELTFLRHYLDIQRTRFGDRLGVRIDVDAAVHAAMVPSMVLQPLVENSIRHAVELRADGGTVTLRGTRVDDSLVIEVADDGPGMMRDAGGEDGIGLSNTSARLLQLYGAKHELRLENNDAGGLRVTLTLPWRTGDP